MLSACMDWWHNIKFILLMVIFHDLEVILEIQVVLRCQRCADWLIVFMCD